MSLKATLLDYAAYVVRQDSTRTAVRLEDYVTVPTGAHIEVRWLYGVPVRDVAIESAPSATWQVYWLDSRGEWNQATQHSSMGVTAWGLKLVPSIGCVARVTITLKSQQLQIVPDEIVVSNMTEPVEVQISSTTPGFVIGWIDGPGWHVAVQAREFVPISQKIIEGFANLENEFRELPFDPFPQLPYEVSGQYYAYGPVYVWHDQIFISSTREELYLATVELGVLPGQIGLNMFPIPVSTLWVLTVAPATIKTFLPKMRRVRTTGVWKNDMLVASDKLPACVVFDSSLAGYNLLIIDTNGGE